MVDDQDIRRKEWFCVTTRRRVLFWVVILVLAATPSSAEVQLFVTKNTVKLYDPGLGEHSVLNDFSAAGWKTHNNLAVVWSDREVMAYDVRTHQWIPLDGLSVRSALLSDELAVVWGPQAVAVFNGPEPQWVVGPALQGAVKTALVSRKMALAMTHNEFMVYDSVLKNWQTAVMDHAEAVFDGALGDNLAVCWDAQEVCVYDMTTHRWEVRPVPGVQAAVVLERELRVVTAESVHTYDAMKHRWSQKPR